MIVVVDANFTNTGAIDIAGGSSFVSGLHRRYGSPNVTFTGSVSGTGELDFFAGTYAVNRGTVITVSNWSCSGDATMLNENLTYAGVFAQTGGVLTIAAGKTLILTGSAHFGEGSFSHSTVIGAGTVEVSSGTLGRFALGGTATLKDVGTVDQTGAATIGDASSDGATLLIGAGARYQIDKNTGIARGASRTSLIRNNGLLIKSGGTGTSRIRVRIKDTGTIEAASGTLDFTRSITGGGTMAVDTGATLEIRASAAAALAMAFNGGDAILTLGKPSRFAATIHGFAATDTIDLLATQATRATLKGGDRLVIFNGGATVATLQLAGDYSTATFNVSSDGHGGTNVTVTTPGTIANVSHAFVAAMAGLGAGGGAMEAMGQARPDTWRPALSTPKSHFA